MTSMNSLTMNVILNIRNFMDKLIEWAYDVILQPETKVGLQNFFEILRNCLGRPNDGAWDMAL